MTFRPRRSTPPRSLQIEPTALGPGRSREANSGPKKIVSASAAVNPERLARFVAAQKGAQFTPAGVLKFSLKSTAADEILTRLKRLLEDLSAGQVVQPGPQLAASD
ncbi:MAG: hypothetical protein LAO06_16215 [Acidobacteriia bacterium]|nr:hypothetical protein [Terriglobia bacterium]